MNMARLITFIRMPVRRKKLFFVACFHLLHAWYVVRTSGFVKYAHKLGVKKSGDYVLHDGEISEACLEIRWAINTASRALGDRFTCLMIAIAAKAMLQKAKIPNALVLGATPGALENDMLAHAWVRVGSIVILGAEEMKTYTPIMSYVDEAD